MSKSELIARITWLCAAMSRNDLARLYGFAVRRWPTAAMKETRL